MSLRRAAFLDRDGVLNDSIWRDGRPCAPLTLQEYRTYEGVGREIGRLHEAGLLCIVFTNQPEVARRLLTLDTLEEMHRRLRSEVSLDDIYVCPHERSEGCPCCKPRPGMLLEAARKWSVDLRGSFVVGDRWSDIEAGRAVGAYTILVDRGYSECPAPDARVEGLEGAVRCILLRMEEGRGG